MVLPETEPGTPLGDVLPLVEEVLLVESTGNRPDLLSIYGLAREVAALYDLAACGPCPGSDPRPVPTRQVDVDGRGLRRLPALHRAALPGRSRSGPSPIWLRARLHERRHAPDLERRRRDQLRDARARQPAARVRPRRRSHGGQIIVRRARPGETLRTLDGVERELEPTDLMIADAERSVALAGIMGGEETEIGESTSEVLLEAANFEPTTIFRSSERLRLRTEGSNRWEKGVDPYSGRAGGETRDRS